MIEVSTTVQCVKRVEIEFVEKSINNKTINHILRNKKTNLIHNLEKINYNK